MEIKKYFDDIESLVEKCIRIFGNDVEIEIKYPDYEEENDIWSFYPDGEYAREIFRKTDPSIMIKSKKIIVKNIKEFAELINGDVAIEIAALVSDEIGLNLFKNDRKEEYEKPIVDSQQISLREAFEEIIAALPEFVVDPLLMRDFYKELEVIDYIVADNDCYYAEFEIDEVTKDIAVLLKLSLFEIMNLNNPIQIILRHCKQLSWFVDDKNDTYLEIKYPGIWKE